MPPLLPWGVLQQDRTNLEPHIVKIGIVKPKKCSKLCCACVSYVNHVAKASPARNDVECSVRSEYEHMV